jgi:hypothetical protein
MHFRQEQAGPDIPERCTDGCPIEESCPFSAIGIYLEYRPFPDMRTRSPAVDAKRRNPQTWPFTVLGQDTSHEGRLRALQTGPYGRCVYRCDNDVVDHQIVSMEFEGGASVQLAMHGHSNEEHRSMRYDGSRATLRAKFGDRSEISIYDHGSGLTEQIPLDQEKSGHGGGDRGIMHDFLAAVRGESKPLTTARTSLESHLLAFAAEEARTSGEVIDMETYRARAEKLTA